MACCPISFVLFLETTPCHSLISTKWQAILPSTTPEEAPYKYGYPAVLPSSQILYLPIRPLPNSSTEAVASLIINQAAISVVDELGAFLGEKIRELNPDVLVGLPTLGLNVASLVAKSIGHGNMLVKYLVYFYRSSC